MNRQIICLLTIFAAANFAAAKLDVSAWSHVAPVTVDAPAQKGVAEFALSPQVLDLAKPDLSDLRVTTLQGDEAGYALRLSGGASEPVLSTGKLYNRTFIPGKQSSVTVDFGTSWVKNRLEIDTSGDNFRRKVIIEGSDDGRRWQVVRNDGMLIRVTEGGSVAYNKSTVTIPDNDQRYLRITVRNGAGDPGKIEILSLNVWKNLSTGKTIPVTLASQKREEKAKERQTVLTVDLGFRNLPLWKISLLPDDAGFYRPVTIRGRDMEKREISIPREDAPTEKKIVDEPWYEIASGAIFRYPGRTTGGDSLTLNLDGAKYRYLQIVIYNENNAPLKNIDIAVSRLEYALDFQPLAGREYRLYTGNSAAQKPVYDIARFIDSLRKEGIAKATLGSPTANPAYKVPGKTLPWSEQHKAILWAALIAIFLILLVLIIRQMRATKTEEEKG